MTDDLTETFVTESKENITQLNNSLLALESDPADEEAIDSIFRQAHTLKGNFAAMGYQRTSEVAHAVEDLLDEIRHGTLEVTPERMDLVFEGVDAIEELLDDIAEHGEERHEPAIVDRLRDAVADGGMADAGDEGDAAGGRGDQVDAAGDTSDEGDAAGDGGDGHADPASDGPEPPTDDASGDHDDPGTAPTDVAGVPVVQDPPPAVVDAATDVLPADGLGEADSGVVAARFGIDGGGMAGADASLMLEQLREQSEILGAAPPIEEIEVGEYGDEVTVFLEEANLDGAAEAVADAWGVTDPEVIVLGDPGTAPGVERDGRSGSGDETSDSGDESPDSDDGEGPDSDDAAPDADADVESIDDVQSVRVDVETLDELHETVEQLVTSRIKLRQTVEDGDLAAATDALEEVDKVSSSIQGTVMDMRLIPLKKVFNKFPRLVRDVSRAQGKRVDFEVRGEDIELDRTIIDEISDPLMHALRNAVDHGIEPPEKREAAGKPPTGEVRLRARREQDTVHITVEDDGRGLDREALVEKAAREGIATVEELEQLSDDEIYQLIFHPGFSTNEEVTDVSGRGVGMDVVRTTVESLDGSVAVDSTPGEGTTITLDLPVTVAIVRVLFVEVADQLFGLPIKYIDEISTAEGILTMNGEEAITHEEAIYPLVRLREVLEKDQGEVDVEPDRTAGMIVRVRESERRIALHCDAVTRQEEVVITPLQGVLGEVDGVSGTSVIGDGHVIPILDPTTLPLPGASDDSIAGRLLN